MDFFFSSYWISIGIVDATKLAIIQFLKRKRQKQATTEVFSS